MIRLVAVTVLLALLGGCAGDPAAWPLPRQAPQPVSEPSIFCWPRIGPDIRTSRATSTPIAAAACPMRITQ